MRANPDAPNDEARSLTTSCKAPLPLLPCLNQVSCSEAEVTQQFYCLDQDSTEEVSEEWVENLFRAKGGDASSSSSSSGRKKSKKSGKKNKNKKQKKQKQTKKPKAKSLKYYSLNALCLKPCQAKKDERLKKGNKA